MSLPVRPHSQYPFPQDKQSPCALSTDKKSRTPQKQSTKPLTTPTKTSTMSQSIPDSSPLSSQPATLTPPASSCPASSPEVLNRLTSTPPEKATTTASSSTVATEALTESESPTENPTPNVAKKHASAAAKRSRDDDNEEGSPPPKKPTTKSNAKTKAKAKPVAKKSSPTNPPTKTATAKKPAPPPPIPSTRPSRNRKPPERFEDLQEATPAKTTPAPKKGSSKVFDPVFITTSSTSRLGKADVYHMLLEPSAWTSLSAAQQTTLLSMLPTTDANKVLLDKTKAGQTQDTRPQAFTMSNDCFRTDVAKFKEDLKNGHLAKTWQAAAEQAVIERAAGEFDKWKAEEAEAWWGQKADGK